MTHPFRDARELSRWLHTTGMVAVFIEITRTNATIYNPQYKFQGLTYLLRDKRKSDWEWELARKAASKWDVKEWGKVVGLDGLFAWESLKYAQSEYPDLKIRSYYTTEQFLDIY